MKRILGVVGLVSVLSVAGAVIAPPVAADCLPCVYVRNTDPWVYVEVCSPV